VDYRLDTPEEVASLMQAKWRIGLPGGILVANPVPESWQLDLADMERTIQTAIQEAEAQGIRGKAITPFLLSRIEQLSGGKSLETNIELVCHNAALAAQVAIAFCKL
jgi:pseudouridylate synthase